MSSYTEGQTHQLMDSLELAGFTPAEITTLGQAGGTVLNEISLVLKGGAKIVSVKPVEKPVPAVVDNIIRVDRSVRPVYPDWVRIVMHPELEATGPVEYDVTSLEQWLHGGQKNGGWVRGEKIYEHLKDKKMLESCLGLADLVAIQSKGIAFFRQHFAGKALFGWRSVVRRRNDNLLAPYLYESGDEVVLYWYWLNNDWNGLNPALRFAS